jgi:glutamyl-tRNA reductase
MTEVGRQHATAREAEGATIFAAGLSFKTAPVELRERLAVPPSDQAAMGQRLKSVGELSEVVLLWTCNRVEIYGVAPEVNGNVEAMFRRLTARPDGLASKLYCYENTHAIRHLFEVAGGLDSMVLGETEITGQVKTAYETAREAKLTGKVLNRLFQKALQTSKEIRTRTGIGSGATSVGSVAVTHVNEIFGPRLPEQTIMVIGAGKMAETCIRHLDKRGAKSLIVANRSLDRARELATQFGGKAVHFDACFDAMADADIVVSSTGCPYTLIEKEHIAAVMERRGGRDLVIIDIAVPRDVAPAVGDIEGVHLFDIDDLENTVRQTLSHREEDLELCGHIIDRKVEGMSRKLSEPQTVSFTATNHGKGGYPIEKAVKTTRTPAGSKGPAIKS